MKLFLKMTLSALAAILTLSVGCSDRGTDIDSGPALQGGDISPQNHVFFNEFVVQIRNRFQILQMASYIPRVSFPPSHGGELKPVPTLFLLPPQDGDHYFYFNHGLKQLANELISDGTIQPMVIVCISNDRVFGGYFYGGHSPAAGDYDAIIGDKLIDYIHYAHPYTIATRAKTGIGGVGMGAYGAFRATLLHDTVFSSVSAVDGPLDFDGADGNSGFIDLFNDALMEQGILGDTLNKFDSSGAWHLSRLFTGGALAFSPHDTAITWDSVHSFGRPIITITSRQSLSDSATLVTDLVLADERDLDFHLPFDSTGTKYDPIWSMWLDNNLENILNPTDDQFSGVNMWVATSPEAGFGYPQQTASWISTLQGAPYNYPVTVKTYSGYDGNPATGSQYIYDLMREILIFHSESFGD